MGPVGWYHYHLLALDCSPAVPSHFVPHIPLKRVHHDSNPDQFNEDTRSHPTNNRTHDLALRFHLTHLFIPFPSHIFMHPPPLSALTPSCSKNILPVLCQNDSPLPPLISLCDTNLYMVCTHTLFSSTSFNHLLVLYSTTILHLFTFQVHFPFYHSPPSTSQRQFPSPLFHTFFQFTIHTQPYSPLPPNHHIPDTTQYELTIQFSEINHTKSITLI
jgi:hypothetical protein